MEPNGTQESVQRLGEPAGRGCRLLLVDPDRPVREALGEAFRMHGFEVRAVSDLSELGGPNAVAGFDAGLVDVGRGRPAEWRGVEALRQGGIRHLAAMSVRSGVGKGREAAGLEAVWEKPLILDEVLCWLQRVRAKPASP